MCTKISKSLEKYPEITVLTKEIVLDLCTHLEVDNKMGNIVDLRSRISK